MSDLDKAPSKILGVKEIIELTIESKFSPSAHEEVAVDNLLEVEHVESVLKYQGIIFVAFTRYFRNLPSRRSRWHE